MTFEEYQKESRKTAIYPNIGDNFVYPTVAKGNIEKLKSRFERDKISGSGDNR